MVRWGSPKTPSQLINQITLEWGLPIVCENWWPNRIGRLTPLPPTGTPPIYRVTAEWVRGWDVAGHHRKRWGVSDGAGWPLLKEPEVLDDGQESGRAALRLPAYTSENLWEDWSQLQMTRAWVLCETSQGVVRLVSDLRKGFLRSVWVGWVGWNFSEVTLRLRLSGTEWRTVFATPLTKSCGWGVKNWSSFLIYKCNKYCLRRFSLWVVK